MIRGCGTLRLAAGRRAEMAVIACCARCARSPSAEELSAPPAAGLAAGLAEAYRITGELTAQAGWLAARLKT